MSFTPYITPWKTTSIETGYPDIWPAWTSPDVFVDNTGARVQADFHGAEYHGAI